MQITKEKTWRELDEADWERIRKESKERDEREPRAKAVRYDPQSDRVIVELKSGLTLMIPPRLLQGVAGADPELIAQVETDRRGYALNWESLNAGVTIPMLLAGCFGSAQWMEQLRASEKLPTRCASTPAKAMASRANGKLGKTRKKAVA